MARPANAQHLESVPFDGEYTAVAVPLVLGQSTVLPKNHGVFCYRGRQLSTPNKFGSFVLTISTPSGGKLNVTLERLYEMAELMLPAAGNSGLDYVENDSMDAFCFPLPVESVQCNDNSTGTILSDPSIVCLC